LSHELRTPLTPVIALLPALLENKDFPEEMRADLQMIQRNVQLEAHLINDLLDLTGIAKGRLHLNLQKVDAHDLTHHALTIVEESANAKKINLHVSLKAEHPHIWGDSVRLQQVLWNILENAIKFTPEEGDVWISSSNPEPGKFQLKCVDNGKGIKPEELGRIFNAFEQVAAPGGYRFGGLGLGLFISRAVLERHGGSIDACSEGADEGATFVIELPVLNPTEPSADAAPLRDILVVRPLCILLVEDHANTREVMTRLLTKRGHTVRAAESLQTAFELVATNQFDLIISDLGLPDGSGLDLMPELKSRYGLKGIAVSGYGMEEDLNKSRRAGFSAHLVKPVDFRQLEAALLKVLAEENEKRV
jgi:CheY-like chemotaxis protein